MNAVEQRFNLVDEAWIPVADVGLVSLRRIFSDTGLRALGGTPIQKIAITKILLAVAQAAYTPKDDAEWSTLGAEGIARKALQYLVDKRDLFWLYGEKPFLQMPEVLNKIQERKERELATAKKEAGRKKIIENALPKSIGTGFCPDLPSENNTTLFQLQIGRNLSDSEKALFIVTLMNFALGGKRVEKDLATFTPDFTGKTDSAKSGPSLGNYVGYLHSYITGENIAETIWCNLFTQEQIDQNYLWKNKLGTPPWEKMPAGEACSTANQLKESYMGCLVALCRFVLLKEDGIYYVEGIQYPSHKTGWREPSMATMDVSKGVKILWADPAKKPWRQLTSLLSYAMLESQDGFDCPNIRAGIPRLRKIKNVGRIGIWSGALKVRGSAGDQSVKQDDDFVESETDLDLSCLGVPWLAQLKSEMIVLDDLADIVWSASNRYFLCQKAKGKDQATQAQSLFWQLCERKFQLLVDACGNDAQKQADKETKKLRRTFVDFVNKAYDTYCSKETARQLDAWAANRPNLAKYIQQN